MSAAAEQRYRESPKGRETRRRWYAANKVKQQTRIKAWTEANRARLVEYHKEYYTNNKAKILLKSTKAGARRRNLAYQLPDALALDLMSDACFYCGDATELNGIDRVDNSRGYLEDNVVTACKACNRAKHARSRADFEAWALRLAANITRWQTKVA